MQSVSARIWTLVAMSISNDDNHYTTGIGIYCIFWGVGILKKYYIFFIFERVFNTLLYTAILSLKYLGPLTIFCHSSIWLIYLKARNKK